MSDSFTEKNNFKQDLKQFEGKDVPTDFGEQGAINQLFTTQDSGFTSKVLDGPYILSDVVYNVKARKSAALSICCFTNQDLHVTSAS